MIPNTHPPANNPYRVSYKIAFIVDKPSDSDRATGRVLSTNYTFDQLCHQANIIPTACFIGHIQNTDTLWQDLLSFGPNIIVTLGQEAFAYFRTVAGIDSSITLSSYRGSLYSVKHTKCLSTFHPDELLFANEKAPILLFDLLRARQEGCFFELTLPQRDLIIPDSQDNHFFFVQNYLSTIKETKPLISIDIEGTVRNMSCISVADSPFHSVIIPFTTGSGSYWTDIEKEKQIWKSLASVLEDPTIPKVLQNSLYDNFVLSYAYQLPIRGIVDDTMLKHWELYSEMEKSLGFQTSIYTKEPYYKGDIKSNDLQTFWKYCCKDSAVTHEINQVLEVKKPQYSYDHYRFNINLLNPILFMELHGIRYDYQKALQRGEQLKHQITTEQQLLNTITGRELNVGSSKQMIDYFYNYMGYEPYKNRKTGAPTLNYEALLKLAKKTNDPASKSAIRLRSLTTRERMLRIRPDSDGRIRCGYNVCGTESGRLTCYTSPTGSGYNLTTIPEQDRDCFLADYGFIMEQDDLRGADGWTVAAHCAALGDPTMLDDLLAGIQIAKVIASMFLDGPEISRLQRSELKKHIEKIEKKNPIYFASKCVYHGSNYMMKKRTLSATIFIQSEGEINISEAEADKLQQFYFQRYKGVQLWQNWILTQIKQRGYIVSASGHKRIFFGQKNDPNTHKEALADEPQQNTTYATNLSALRMWNDPDNRTPDGGLIVEPLHQIHDALLKQFEESKLSFAREKSYEWFNNPLRIHGIEITIPFEGRAGDNWGNLTIPI